MNLMGQNLESTLRRVASRQFDETTAIDYLAGQLRVARNYRDQGRISSEEYDAWSEVFTRARSQVAAVFRGTPFTDAMRAITAGILLITVGPGGAWQYSLAPRDVASRITNWITTAGQKVAGFFGTTIAPEGSVSGQSEADRRAGNEARELALLCAREPTHPRCAPCLADPWTCVPTWVKVVGGVALGAVALYYGGGFLRAGGNLAERATRTNPRRRQPRARRRGSRG
jgi:hypothetical protein